MGGLYGNKKQVIIMNIQKGLRILNISCIITSSTLVLAFTNCKPKPGLPLNTPVEEQVVDTLPADFVEFYDKFHTDSLYQMEHIIFPLEGLPNSLGDGDTTSTKRFFWKREEWKKHNHFNDPSGQFEHWYQVLDERLIEHWVQMKGTDMVIHRRFARLDDGWYLIYYAGLRPHEE